MPLIQPPPTSALSFIDAAPSDSSLAAAQQLIQAELPAEHTTTLHSSLPPLRASKFSDLVEQEHTRLLSGAPKETGTGIDPTRYDAPEAPTNPSDTTAWNSALKQAYTSLEYLRSRQLNLSLLETYGKNAWLVGNSQLEGQLKALERDVEGAKLELEAVEQSRRAGQENARGELLGLEEGWKTGVGRLIEVLAAGEGLRGEILEKQRQSAR